MSQTHHRVSGDRRWRRVRTYLPYMRAKRASAGQGGLAEDAGWENWNWNDAACANANVVLRGAAGIADPKSPSGRAGRFPVDGGGMSDRWLASSV